MSSVAVLALPVARASGFLLAQAKNGDTHITGQGITQTLDCNDSTLIVVGTGNTVTAVGTCWAVTVQGSSNIVDRRQRRSTTSPSTASIRRCSIHGGEPAGPGTAVASSA